MQSRLVFTDCDAGTRYLQAASFRLKWRPWVCTPRPRQRISLLPMQLLNLRGGGRRQSDLDNAKSFAASKASICNLRLVQRKSLRIRRSPGFDPHRPYQTTFVICHLQPLFLTKPSFLTIEP